MTDQQATDDRFPMTLEELKIGKGALSWEPGRGIISRFRLVGRKIPWRSDMTRFS
jgi:hypothetical protein